MKYIIFLTHFHDTQRFFAIHYSANFRESLCFPYQAFLKHLSYIELKLDKIIILYGYYMKILCYKHWNFFKNLTQI